MRIEMGLVAALSGLAACSDGSSGPEALTLGEAFAADQAEFDALRDGLDERNNTAFVNMPISGAATFEGLTEIEVGGDDPGDLVLVGDARLTADFEDDRLYGRASDFIGLEDGTDVEAYDGALVLEGGRIGEGVPNDASGRLAGTLTSADHELAIDGAVDGKFVGNPLAGILISEGEVPATLDGEATEAEVNIAAGLVERRP